ncbi:carboxylic ester hydrolase [Sphingobium sp. TA15]|uniref:Carboxylic ester hydrolase n=1 Tax=Sphingobium indicum (strain DSM 16413 / CCM 7287 / MTCC 6362 / UT26 / NBRC 101211 / UT26S) TaxID=452662 RepID=D4Z7Y1_SPHIU|nr:carboxylesterase family protein [Sphingobium indicum]BAI98600.1 para-nitrobenzyl esterase [Sphingobium indicum UT26S]BDD68653.1 carboxylic ester hydrolase [Sphingobium sp. TA15]
MTGRAMLFDRRQALLASSLGGTAALLAGEAAAATRAAGASGSSGSCATPRNAIARTRYGPVRGYVAGDVFTFKGIPYGDDTGGENRWLPARPPKAWTDPYPALAYGANCPQTLHSFRAKEHTFLQQWTDGFLGEDMLKLNIWTPSLSGNRPVMVYFHGGGFAFGSSYELASHDGAQMARHHDVVQVSINHRLNVLGFLDLTEVGGDPYAESVNVSMTDCIAALRWVQENIAAFGGNPDRIMIYGQSGGASKVTTLMGMPSGKGLIHRAAAQSGGGGNIPTLEQSREFSRRVVKELGVGPRDIGALQKMDWATLFAAGNKAADQINGPRAAGGPSASPRVGWNPTLDGRVITVRSFFDAAPDASRDVPMLIGNTSEEGMRFGQNPTEAEWRAELAGQYGPQRADALIAQMKRDHPEKAIRTLSYGVASLGYRNRIQSMVALRDKQPGSAPMFQYLFQWQSPQLDGVAGAWHTADLAFVFDNSALCDQGTGNTPEARKLARTMATAWANFARTGNPSQPGLAWTPTDAVRCRTMIFDNQCRMVDDPEGTARRIILG